MTKTLTEQWREGTLKRGYYYYETKAGAKVIGYQCFGLKFPYDYNHNTIDSVKEVIAPVPSYEEYQKLKKLEEQLDSAITALYEYIKMYGIERECSKFLQKYAEDLK